MPAKARAKRVVYLWGAGGTHAESRHLGATVSLLMRDTDEFGEGINSRILRRSGRRTEASFKVSSAVDIEKVISLLAASGKTSDTETAAKLRRNYFLELRQSLFAAGVLKTPHLAIELLTLHRNDDLRANVESLEGIITTNHDGLLQVAIDSVYGSLDLGIDFRSSRFTMASPGSVPPLLQLHGSFAWQFGVPIHTAPLNARTPYEDTVWIPPTILKEAKSYPFNKLTGAAYELLARRCDVLRVVGTSLTQNDWNILSLIFNAQRHREALGEGAFRVELILPHEVGMGIVENCSYLRNVFPIGFLTDGRFSEYKEYEDKSPPRESDLANPFKYWLSEKLRFHRLNGDIGSGNRASSESRAEAVI